MQGTSWHRAVLKVSIVAAVNAIVVLLTERLVDSIDVAAASIAIFTRITSVVAAYAILTHVEYTHLTRDGKKLYASLLEKKVREYDDGELSAMELLKGKWARCNACNKCKAWHFKLHVTLSIVIAVGTSIVALYSTPKLDALLIGIASGMAVSSIITWYTSKRTASKLQYYQFLQECLKSLGDGDGFNDNSDKRGRGGSSPTTA